MAISAPNLSITFPLVTEEVPFLLSCEDCLVPLISQLPPPLLPWDCMGGRKGGGLK